MKVTDWRNLYIERALYISDVCTNSFSNVIDMLYHTLADSIHISDACDVSFGKHSLKTCVPTYWAVPMSL